MYYFSWLFSLRNAISGRQNQPFQDLLPFAFCGDQRAVEATRVWGECIHESTFNLSSTHRHTGRTLGSDGKLLKVYLKEDDRQASQELVGKMNCDHQSLIISTSPGLAEKIGCLGWWWAGSSGIGRVSYTWKCSRRASIHSNYTLWRRLFNEKIQSSHTAPRQEGQASRCPSRQSRHSRARMGISSTSIILSGPFTNGLSPFPLHAKPNEGLNLFPNRDPQQLRVQAAEYITDGFIAFIVLIFNSTCNKKSTNLPQSIRFGESLGQKDQGKSPLKHRDSCEFFSDGPFLLVSAGEGVFLERVYSNGNWTISKNQDTSRPATKTNQAQCLYGSAIGTIQKCQDKDTAWLLVRVLRIETRLLDLFLRTKESDHGFPFQGSCH